jgi:hypothetical protein
MRTATPITVSLTEHYRREFMAAILAGMIFNATEPLSLNVDVPAADWMVANGLHEELEPFLAQLAPLERALASLRVVADMGALVLDCPFAHDELVEGMRGVVALLHESIGQTASDRVEDHARAITAARAYLDSLRRETEGARAGSDTTTEGIGVMEEDGHDEIGELFAVTVDELRHTNDLNRALVALGDLWERVEDMAMLREAIRDAGADWLWDALLASRIKGDGE